MRRVLPSASRAPSTPGRAFAAMLATALVLVQLLGLAHRIVHVERVRLAGPTAVALAAGGGDPPVLNGKSHGSGVGWLLALFAGHDPGADCDAFDHVSHADVAVNMTLDAALPAAGSEACLRHAAWHVAAQAQGFLARAPPFAA